MKIIPSVWGSIVAFCNTQIDSARIRYPESEIGFIDWESHANLHELPDKDLIGPTTLSITELSPQMMEISFAVAVSSYSTDQNLFRMRDYLSEIYEAMRPNKQLAVFDSSSAQKIGYMVMTDGTLLAPMSRAETRPFQYVQATALLEPVLT